MSDDDGIIVTGGDSTAEAPAVLCFKVFLRGDQDVSGGIELQELCCPLLRQMVGDDKQGFRTKSKPFRLHCSSDHLESLARTNRVCQ